MSMNVGDRNIQQSQGPGPVDLSKVTSQPKLETPSQKLDTNQQAGEAQKNKPSILNSDAARFAQKACGFSLLTVGVAGVVVFAPITIPMGLLGAGLGLAVGKAFGHEKAGMFIGEAVGSLLFSGVAFAGAKLVQNAQKSSGNEKAGETKVSDAKIEASPKKLIMNEAETKFQKGINDLRETAQKGSLTKEEIQQKKETRYETLKGKEYGKEFKKSAMEQLNKLDADFEIGLETVSNQNTLAYEVLKNGNGRALELYKFVKDNTTDYRDANNESFHEGLDIRATGIERNQAKINTIKTSNSIADNLKAPTMHNTGKLGMLTEDQNKILDNFKNILTEKNPDNKAEIKKSIETLKAYIDFDKPLDSPSDAEVTKAKNSLINFANGTLDPAKNLESVANDESPVELGDEEVGVAVGAEIDRLMGETEVSEPEPVKEAKAPTFQEQLAEVKGKLAEVTIEKRSLKLHIIELEKIENPNAQELNDLKGSQANLLKLIDEDLKLNMDLIGLSRRNETTKLS